MTVSAARRTREYRGGVVTRVAFRRREGEQAGDRVPRGRTRAPDRTTLLAEIGALESHVVDL